MKANKERRTKIKRKKKFKRNTQQTKKKKNNKNKTSYDILMLTSFTNNMSKSCWLLCP